MTYTGKHYYTYSDPQVLAVLASPPYFSDLLDRDDLSGNYAESSTTYSSMKGTENGTSSSSTISVGAYVSFEQEFSVFGVKIGSVEAEAAFTSGFTYETEHTSSLEQSITYETTSGEDRVAFYSIPMEIYEYTSYIPDGKGSYTKVTSTVSIPHEASIGLIDLSDYEIINEPDKVQASLKAVKLAHDGVANMYMKGLLDTKTFLKSVLDKEVGLRTGHTLSHVAVFEVKGIEQLLFLTDVAFMTYPTLEDKVHIIENTVAVAHACGVECPKVAPLAAVEVVNPKMPCTVDADELRKMNAEGKITGCVVDGPLSMDIAIDPEAAHHKGAQDRPAAGHADILLFPDIQAGNLVYKTLVHTADCKNGCILTGTKVPAILTSRSDSFQTKVNSIALAAVVAAGLNQ